MTDESWTTVTLGDIVENINVRVDDPSKSGLDRFVGLVHLDSGSVTVSRWDSTESVTSSMKQFQSGDVLLARRNAHLRRASAVDFEGVCSGDAYVLREKPDAIVPGLLKYILNTNRFWEYAIANADGSMSTRVKWSFLSSYPLGDIELGTMSPKHNILDTVNESISISETVKHNIQSTIKSILSTTLFPTLTNPPPPRRLDSIGKIVTGTTPKTKNREYYGGIIPFISPADMGDSVYVDSTKSTLTQQGMEKSRPLPENSVLFVCIGATIGKTGMTSKNSATNQQINAIICNDDVNPKYLYYVLTFLSNGIKRMGAASTIPIINKGDFSQIKVPLLPKKEQDNLVEKLEILEDQTQTIEHNIQSKSEVMKFLINDLEIIS